MINLPHEPASLIAYIIFLLSYSIQLLDLTFNLDKTIEQDTDVTLTSWTFHQDSIQLYQLDSDAHKQEGELTL